MKKFWILLITLLILVACQQQDDPEAILTLPEDSYDLVTLTPRPTETPVPTAEPIIEDASGIGRAFFRAWEGMDFLGMYSLLAPETQAVVDSQAFVAAYEDAMTTAVVRSISSQPLSMIQEDDEAEFGVQVTWDTAVIGSITRDFAVPLVYQQGRWGILWDESLILPELAGGNRLFLDYRIPARANIYDINGLALAFQGSIITLGVIPGQIEDEEAMLAALSPVLNLPPEEIQAIYAPALPDWYWPIGEVREEVMQQYGASLQPFFGKGLASPDTRLTRLYTDEGIAPHIVGYTGFIPAEEIEAYQAQGFRGDEQVGRAGLELWGEDYLNGERGGVLTVVGPSGEYISTIQEKESKQARSLYTTIRRDFQHDIEEMLADAINTHPLAEAGSIIIMDVNTGAIRAMASYPTYNPVVFDTLRQDSPVELGRVFNDPGQPLLNRATQGKYPPGSLFKIVTLTAGLNSGLYTLESRYTSTGSWNRLGDSFIKYDWPEDGLGHGNVSYQTALVVSCNSCFYDMGYNLDEMDPTFLPAIARQFGLNQVTGIQLAEDAGLIPDPDWKLQTQGEGWARGDAVNMAIGQGFVQVTPIQMVSILAAVANSGTLYQPTVVDRIGSGGGAPEEPIPPVIRGELPLSTENLKGIQEALWRVANTQSGTAAYQFERLPIALAGKTGTAEAPPNDPHAWFAGYAPAEPYTLRDGTLIEQPEIAVLVMIENSGEGSEVAAPIFRRAVEMYYDITPRARLPWE